MKFIYFLPLLLIACGEPSGGGLSAPKGDISINRSTAFKSFMPTFSKMGKVVKGDEPYDVAQFAQLAEQFSQEARVPFEYFQSDPQGNGDALPIIWTQAEQFQAEQAHFFQAVDALNQAAKHGDLAQIKVTYASAAQACQQCHQTYRIPK